MNQGFIRSLGFSARTFKILTMVSSWAICGERPKRPEGGTFTRMFSPFHSTLFTEKQAPEGDNEHEPEPAEQAAANGSTVARCGFSLDDKHMFGRLAKRLIDVGRQRYLEQELGCRTTLYRVRRRKK